MLFEIGKVVIGEKYFAARPAHKCADRHQALCSFHRQHPHLVLMPHAEQ